MKFKEYVLEGNQLDSRYRNQDKKIKDTLKDLKLNLKVIYDDAGMPYVKTKLGSIYYDEENNEFLHQIWGKDIIRDVDMKKVLQ